MIVFQNSGAEWLDMYSHSVMHAWTPLVPLQLLALSLDQLLDRTLLLLFPFMLDNLFAPAEGLLAGGVLM